MTDADLITALGGATVVARTLGISRQRVTNWRLRGSIASEWRGAVLSLAIERGIQIDAESFLRLPSGLLPAVSQAAA